MNFDHNIIIVIGIAVIVLGGIFTAARQRRARNELNQFATQTSGAKFWWDSSIPILEIDAAQVPIDRVTDLLAITARASLKYQELHLRSADNNLMSAVSAMRSLEKLYAADCPITNEGLWHLSRSTRLEVLDLSRTRITDDGLVALAALPELEQLDLQGTAVDGSGLKHLTQLTRLDSVNLSESKATDAGFQAAAPLPDCRSLDLSGTQVTDQSVPVLTGIRRLRRLGLERTQISADGRDKLNALRTTPIEIDS